MRDQLVAVVNPTTGNVIAICSNIDDAIMLQIQYEERTQNIYEIEEVSKYGAKLLVDREWNA